MSMTPEYLATLKLIEVAEEVADDPYTPLEVAAILREEIRLQQEILLLHLDTDVFAEKARRVNEDFERINSLGSMAERREALENASMRLSDLKLDRLALENRSQKLYQQLDAVQDLMLKEVAKHIQTNTEEQS